MMRFMYTNGVEFEAGTDQISTIRGDKPNLGEIREFSGTNGNAAWSRRKQNLIAAYTRGLLRIAICQEVGGQIRAVSNRVYSRRPIPGYANFPKITLKRRSQFPLGFRILRMDPADYHLSIGFLRIATPFPSNDRRMDRWITITSSLLTSFRV